MGVEIATSFLTTVGIVTVAVIVIGTLLKWMARR